MEAEFTSTCPNCGKTIQLGQKIRREEDSDDLRTVWVHKVCPPERKVPVCEKCWTEKPCECDDD